MEGGGWEPGGRSNPPLGLFGLAMSPRSASYRPKHASMAQETSPYHWGEIQTRALHVAPYMGPIVSVLYLQGCQNSL